MIDELFEKKKELRTTLRQKRQEVSVDKEQAKKSMSDIFFSGISVPEGAIIGSYYAMQSEIDPRVIVDRLMKQGYKIALPCIRDDAKSLDFRMFNEGDQLVTGPMGVPEPPPSAARVNPDYILIPLLGFDRKGHRLGQGSGYYDATLERLRGEGPLESIGLAYAVQEVEEIPCGELDQPLDMIVTEKEIIRP